MQPSAIDPGTVLEALGIIWSVVVFVGAAVIVASRKGLRDSTASLVANQSASIAAMEAHIESLKAENERLRSMVASLQTDVATLRAELDVEKRITSRLERESREASA